MDNPYTTLGVDKTASDADIKKAYRKIAVQCHPDKNPSKQAEERFRKATEAYDVLKDPDKRKNYDKFGTPEGYPGFGGGGFKKRSYDYGNIHVDLSDMFGSSFGSDPFGFSIHDILRKQQRDQARQTRRRNGETLQARIALTLEEVAAGCNKTIKYKRKVKCPSCKGSGSSTGHAEHCHHCGGSGWHFGKTCPQCGGRGKIIDIPCGACHGERLVINTEEVTFDVPKGVSEDNNLTMKGYGNESPDGGAVGDFVVFVTVKRHDIYTRIKDDIAMTIEIDDLDAILGTQTIIDTIHGNKLRVKVPPGTQPGHKMRLKGQGLPNRYSGVNGDLLILIEVSIPEKLSEEERELYQKIRDLRENNIGDSYE